jgi:hypothetical protein
VSAITTLNHGSKLLAFERAILTVEASSENAAMRAASEEAARHPTKVGTITVPHPKKDLGKGLVLAIREAPERV